MTLENAMNSFLKVMNKMLLTILVLCYISCEQSKQADYLALIERGEFTQAQATIENLLQSDTTLSSEERKQLSFEIERMERIRKDFTKTEQDVLEYIKKYIPNVTAQDLTRWEQEKSLESMSIDGKKRYFKLAARNLFRIDKTCRNIWNEYHKDEKQPEKINLDQHISEIIAAHQETGKQYIKPVRIKYSYSITVKPDMVPEGETIRCWIPYPREISERQFNIKLLTSDPVEHIISDTSYLQRTIYFEKPSQGSEETKFSLQYEYTSQAIYVDIDPEKVKATDPDSPLKAYLQEEYPHIVFSDELKELSQKIVGNETNPYRKAQQLFTWVDQNIPWASAREYSTIRHISSYCYQNMHGDCGIMALLQITLCRMNGIPARWQSGWEFQPPDNSMHDWAMVYFEPYGWLPMDVDYGLRKSDDQKIKFFYLGGIDSYRLVFNDAYSQPFYPEKVHHRSETVDSQRGELEWLGGNLYYDQWDWNMNYEVLSQ